METTEDLITLPKYRLRRFRARLRNFAWTLLPQPRRYRLTYDEASLEDVKDVWHRRSYETGRWWTGRRIEQWVQTMLPTPFIAALVENVQLKTVDE